MQKHTGQNAQIAWRQWSNGVPVNNEI